MVTRIIIIFVPSPDPQPGLCPWTVLGTSVPKLSQYTGRVKEMSEHLLSSGLVIMLSFELLAILASAKF